MKLLKALLTIGGFTFLSRITGLLREIMMARIFGATPWSDAFYVAFRIPNLLRRILAEGAFSQAFVPEFMSYYTKNDKVATKGFFDSVFTAVTWVLFALCMLGMYFSSHLVSFVTNSANYDKEVFKGTVLMMKIMFPYIIIISAITLASTVLNIYRLFIYPSFSPVLLNIIFISLAIFVAPHVKIPVLVFSWAVVFGGLAQLLIQLIGLKTINMVPNVRLNFWNDLKDPKIRNLFVKMIPGIFAVSISQISLTINTNIASHLGLGALSCINYADRLMEFPTALFGNAISSILLPSLSKSYLDKNDKEYSSLLDWSLYVMFLFSVPCFLMLLIFSKPLVATLFNYGAFNANTVGNVSYDLSFYSVGLISLISLKIFAPAFYARGDIKTPAKVGLVSLIITQICNCLFVPFFSHAGLTLSIGIGCCFNAITLFIISRMRNIYIPLLDWKKAFVQLAFAGSVIAFFMYKLSRNIDWIGMRVFPIKRFLLLVSCITFFMLLYFAILFIVRFNFTVLNKNFDSKK